MKSFSTVVISLWGLQELLIYLANHFWSVVTSTNSLVSLQYRDITTVTLYYLYSITIILFFLSGFSFTDTEVSQDGRGREGTMFYSSLPLLPAHRHSDIYLKYCMRDGYQAFLITLVVTTRLLLDKIYHYIELPFDWLLMQCSFLFVYLMIWF